MSPRGSSTDHLSSYLNDHLGGAGTGVELARRLARDSAGSADAEVLQQLRVEIAQDRDTLRELVDEVGATRSTVKQAMGWVAEKAHRAGVREGVTGSPALTRLLRVETLSLGVEGKLSLWRALQAVRQTHPHLAEVDLEGLAARAVDQRARLEELRLRAAREAFGTAT
jgi:hypothetical protein